MFLFLETDIREQKKYERQIQTPVDNKVNNLHYKINFENWMKDKKYFFIKQNTALFFQIKKYFILGHIFFEILKNLIASAFVFYWGRYLLKELAITCSH